MTAFKLFLFDLDGTLVSTGGAGLRALGRAFKELYGLDDAHRRVNPSGKTDPAIFREILTTCLQRDMSSSDLATLAECYLHHLGQEMNNSTTKALAGVEAFVSQLAGQADVAIGLGTGNLERGARLKLAPTGLNEFFTFGGFGSDAEERAEVLRFGHRRAEQLKRRTIPADAVVVIGDTPLDIAAAKRAGFRSVAVATGKTSFEELKASSPDFVLRDLRDGARLLDELQSDSAAA